MRVRLHQLDARLVEAAVAACHHVVRRRGTSLRTVMLITNDLAEFNALRHPSQRYTPEDRVVGLCAYHSGDQSAIWIRPTVSTYQAVLTLTHELAHHLSGPHRKHNAPWRTLYAQLLPVVAAVFADVARVDITSAVTACAARYFNPRRSGQLREAVYIDEHARDSAHLWATNSETARLYQAANDSARRYAPQLLARWGRF